MNPEILHARLKENFGFEKFRPNQENIINTILSGQDTLAIMPTGGGKSICFQLPALIFPGITIVISPLIALMKDQVDNLKAKGIKAARVALERAETVSWSLRLPAITEAQRSVVMGVGEALAGKTLLACP